MTNQDLKADHAKISVEQLNDLYKFISELKYRKALPMVKILRGLPIVTVDDVKQQTEKNKELARLKTKS